MGTKFPSSKLLLWTSYISPSIRYVSFPRLVSTEETSWTLSEIVVERRRIVGSRWRWVTRTCQKEIQPDRLRLRRKNSGKHCERRSLEGTVGQTQSMEHSHERFRDWNDTSGPQNIISGQNINRQVSSLRESPDAQNTRFPGYSQFRGDVLVVIRPVCYP